MYVRSVYVVDFKEIIRTVNKTVLDFMLEYDIKSISDLTNLFTSRVIAEMVKVYKSVHDALVVFYIKNSEKKELLGMRDIINYKKFFGLIEKKLGFPFTTGDLCYESFCKMLNTDCPEYEEIVDNHHSFAEVLPEMIMAVRRLKYHKIDRELLKNEKSLFLCLTSL